MEKYSSFKKEISKYKKIAVCSHDAGGAEVLSSFVKKYKKNFFFILSGPAIDIFKKKIKNVKRYSIETSINKSQLLITSTSVRSNIELQAIKYAKKKNKETISVLDHWSRYKDRFTIKKSLVLPDELWTLDREALALSKKLFPKIKIKLIRNPYLDSIKKIRNKKNKRILFVSDNYDDFYNKKGVDFFILKKFLNYLDRRNSKNLLRKIYLKLHPSEKKNKYSNFNFKNVKIQIIFNKKLFKLIKNFGTVVGHQSMALVVAKSFGLKTICVKKHAREKEIIPRKYIDIYI